MNVCNLQPSVERAIKEAVESGKQVFVIAGYDGFGGFMDALPYPWEADVRENFTVATITPNLPMTCLDKLRNVGQALIIVDRAYPHTYELALRLATKQSVIICV